MLNIESIKISVRKKRFQNKYNFQFFFRKFEFYKITHVLIYKENKILYNILKNDSNYETLYEDEYFILYKKLGKSNYVITYNQFLFFNKKN